MKFKGTIIITDPCYVIKKNNYPSPKPADFNLPESIDRKPYKEYKTPDELAYKAACDKYFLLSNLKEIQLRDIYKNLLFL